jgi:hypothetical protein
MLDRRGDGVKQGSAFFRELKRKRKRKRNKKAAAWMSAEDGVKGVARARFCGNQKEKGKKKNFVKKKKEKKSGCLDERGGRSRRGRAHGLHRRA